MAKIPTQDELVETKNSSALSPRGPGEALTLKSPNVLDYLKEDRLPHVKSERSPMLRLFGDGPDVPRLRDVRGRIATVGLAATSSSSMAASSSSSLPSSSSSSPSSTTTSTSSRGVSFRGTAGSMHLGGEKGAAPKPKVLIIFTGGTIGMSKDKDGALRPSKGFLDRTLADFVEIKHPDVPLYDILEWEKPLDSSDFTPACWVRLAKQIHENYFKYEGFVILHGTDTMSYTSSALSFMLENLGKTVVLTGSMIPLEEPVSDAKRNLLVSMMVAAHLAVPEVLLFFNTTLLRGNRAKKTDPWRLVAIESPNMEPLASMGVGIHVRQKLLLRQPSRPFSIHLNLFENIMVIFLTPAFNVNMLDMLATQWKSGPTPTAEPPALVLLLYGSGNAPVRDSRFLESVQRCLQAKMVVVVLSQCLRGSVDISAYEGGVTMAKSGVIDGKDMTVEAAVTKLAYLMGKGLRGTTLKNAMEANIRGELTSYPNLTYTGHSQNPSDLLSKL